MKYQALKNHDLLFASFPSSQAVAAAEQAKLLGLKMTLIQFGNTNLLKNNSNIVLASPSTITQCKLMADYILDQYHFSNFIVLTRNNKKENELADIFKKSTDSLLLNKFKTETKSILINYADSGQKAVLNHLSPEKRNIIYFPSSDESYVSSVLNGLDTLSQKITVVGVPPWENFETIQFSKMLNLEVYIFTGSFLDYDDSKIKSFRKIFIEQYNIDPLFNAYQGFALTGYFSKLFTEYDKNFMDYVSDDMMLSPFKFAREEKGHGYENASISVLKYGDYRLMKVNK